MRTAITTAVATAGFAVLHSALASDRAKEMVAARLPHAREFYRLAFNAQAVLTFGALVWGVSRLPKRTVYRVRGAAAAVMRVGQLGGVAFAIAAARATGIATLAGLGDVVPAAQGPEEGAGGELRVRGPFRIVRHPLNLAPLAPFWLTPHMTTRRLAFNAVATAYLIVGSIHEEQRLLRKYGERYRAYRHGGTPFYVPGPETVLRVLRVLRAEGAVQDPQSAAPAAPLIPGRGAAER